MRDYDEAQKIRARSAVFQALRRGKIMRPDRCERCGDSPSPGLDGRSRIEAHHHGGYSKPLDIEWICARCHRRDESNNRCEKNGRAKLTATQVIEIRQRYGPRLTKHLAREYGVADQTIRDIAYGRRWSSLS